MDEIHDRLRALRKRLGLSLREMALEVERRGKYAVSHDSIRRYERGGSVPVAYVRALTEAFAVSGSWLLFGHGDPMEASREGRAFAGRGAARGAQIVRQWHTFLRSLPPRHPLRAALLKSWQPLEQPTAHTSGPPRLSTAELNRRLRENRPLIRAAAPHLEWLRAFLAGQPHVVCLLCRRATVIHVAGGERELVERWSLHPGCDWSEEAMGTNSAGTALASGRPVAVAGAEAYREPFHRSASFASPIRGPGGELVGVLDLSVPLDHFRPHGMAAVAYTALMIERELGGGPQAA